MIWAAVLFVLTLPFLGLTLVEGIAVLIACVMLTCLAVLTFVAGNLPVGNGEDPPPGRKVHGNDGSLTPPQG